MKNNEERKRLMSFKEAMNAVRRYINRELNSKEVDDLEPLLDELQIEYDLLEEDLKNA
jgi:hypothetical protein